MTNHQDISGVYTPNTYQNERHLFVVHFFLHGPSWRRPVQSLVWFLNRLLTGGPDHVSIANGLLILVPTFDHASVYPTGLFTTIVRPISSVDISAKIDVRLFDFFRPEPAAPWRTIASVVLRRRSIDRAGCVATTCRVLAAAGIDIPNHITTPRALQRYLSCLPQPS